MKKAGNIISWLLVITITGGLVGFVADRKSQVLCEKVNISIDHTGDVFFIREDEVNRIITDEAGLLINRPMAAIDVHGLEEALNRNPFIADAQVFTTIDGCIKIHVQQRQPLVRLAGRLGKSYYLDTAGVIMPLSRNYAARSLVVNGALNLAFHSGYDVTDVEQDNEEHRMLKDIYELARFIHNDPFWKAQIIQVHVNTDREFELVPRIGDHKILFGKAGNMKEKFSKLLTFYKDGLNATGWSHYKTINLKYHQQIVCTKN